VELFFVSGSGFNGTQMTQIRQIYTDIILRQKKKVKRQKEEGQTKTKKSVNIL